MRLLQATLYRHLGDSKAPIRLAFTSDLSTFSFFARSTIQEHCHFASRMVCQRTQPGQRQTIDQKNDDNPFLLHVYVRLDNLACVVVADQEYPLRVAFSFINKIMAEFERESNERWKRIDQDQDLRPEFLSRQLTSFQDPSTADKLAQIQRNLDDIKDVMHKNIDEVLKRGETLEVLMERSEDLSTTSVQFYKKAKKQNQCCKAY